jgi:hypothetical protein
MRAEHLGRQPLAIWAKLLGQISHDTTSTVDSLHHVIYHVIARRCHMTDSTDDNEGPPANTQTNADRMKRDLELEQAILDMIAEGCPNVD